MLRSAFVGLLVTFVTSAVSLGCRNTWNGVKADTSRAAQKTGQGLQKAGTKIENTTK